MKHKQRQTHKTAHSICIPRLWEERMQEVDEEIMYLQALPQARKDIEMEYGAGALLHLDIQNLLGFEQRKRRVI